MADILSGMTNFRNSSEALILRSIARRGLTVIFNRKLDMRGYNSEKSDWEMCTEPRTVMSQTSCSCSFASLQNDITAFQLSGQYINASELMANTGVWIRCLSSSSGGWIAAPQISYMMP